MIDGAMVFVVQIDKRVQPVVDDLVIGIVVVDLIIVMRIICDSDGDNGVADNCIAYDCGLMIKKWCK